MDAPHNPYSAPSARIADPAGAVTGFDPARVEQVRVGQQWLNYAFLAYLMVTALVLVPGPTVVRSTLLAVAGYLVLITGGAVGLWRIGAGMQAHVVLRVLAILLLFVPMALVPFLVMGLSSARASRFLRKAGFKVGLMGARKP